MKRTLLVWYGVIAAVIASVPNPTHAHRLDAALSLVEVSQSNGRLEVTHTLYAHDLEGALQAGAVPLSWFETDVGQAALRAYCLREFVLSDARGRAIALTFVGIEVRAGIINVYFDAPHYRGTSIIVDSNFLQERSESQVNRVNVRARGETVTEVFPVGASPRRIIVP